MKVLGELITAFAKTVKDDKQKRPLWMKRHDPPPPITEGRGGHKNLEQLLEADPLLEGKEEK